MFTGKPPYEGSSFSSILANRIKGQRRSLQAANPHLSNDSIDLVNTMMAEQPKMRPQDYGELIDSIDGLREFSLDGLHQQVTAETDLATPTVDCSVTNVTTATAESPKLSPFQQEGNVEGVASRVKAMRAKPIRVFGILVPVVLVLLFERCSGCLDSPGPVSDGGIR